MTAFIRDMSHYDSNGDLAGYAGTTHKITEGLSYLDPLYFGRMNDFRTSAAGKVLGSYHVLHTGNLSSQLDYWISQQDRLTPWWRDWPHWIMQIDAEKWPGDPVTLLNGRQVAGPLHMLDPLGGVDPAQHADLLAERISTTVAFAGMLANANLPCAPIAYASRGQYGNSLAGIPIDLWNAAYRSSTYPGDNAADWAPYSGRTPVLWQYTSTPFDKSAFRGSVADLLAYIEGGGSVTTLDDLAATLEWVNRRVEALGRGYATMSGAKPQVGEPVWLVQQVVGMQGKLDAIKSAVGQPVQVTLDDATRQALVSSVTSALAGLDVNLSGQAVASVEQALRAELAKLQITVGQ